MSLKIKAKGKIRDKRFLHTGQYNLSVEVKSRGTKNGWSALMFVSLPPRLADKLDIGSLITITIEE